MNLTLHQFKTIIELTRMDPQSIAAKGAALVLVNGLTQTKAAAMLDCQQTTISRAVRRLREVQRLARHIV
jgi:DNA-binding MarR family transcriptional regulator